MPRGGRREGAGRKPGVPQRHPVRKRQAVVAMEAGAAGLTPVDYMLSVVRNEKLDMARCSTRRRQSRRTPIRDWPPSTAQ
jgi:hypothetical protein